MYTEEQITKEFKKFYGKDAEFHEGQLEAIKAVLAGNRVLVVQKTGWGKSLVYFLATKMMRAQGRGLTLVFSPLLALMNNQFEAARKFFPKDESIRLYNSSVGSDYKRETIELLKEDRVDILFVTPESLTNNDFMEKVMDEIREIGFLVIDEAHCISDWGHDFRPDYMNIVKIVDNLTSNDPVLATTATANDRVINDIASQLRYKNNTKKEMLILRGNLQRGSLYIQVIKIADYKGKLAWLKEHIDDLQKRVGGAGIIYCATINDCQLVAGWLRNNFADKRIEIYNGQVDKHLRIDLETDFLDDKIDILVATSAFGMGIDKPNIGFVIHFSKPKNVIEYYQQIGRAGRGQEIPLAYAVLLASPSDDDVNNFFIRSAFATKDQMMSIFDSIKKADSISKEDIIKEGKHTSGLVDKVLRYLVAQDAVIKYYDSESRTTKYIVKDNNWHPDEEHINQLTQLRHLELGDMNDYIDSKQCHMQYVTALLNDTASKPCGHCAFCKPEQSLSEKCSDNTVSEAESFLNSFDYDVAARKKWAVTNRFIPVNERICGGKIFVLTKYGTGNYGKLVREGKYESDPAYFADELVVAAAKKLREVVRNEDIKYLIPIPSLNHPTLVSSFTERLAKKLGCQYLDILGKTSKEEQKNKHTSVQQQKNIEDSIFIKDNYLSDSNVLLIDDMVDSKWTITVAASKLVREAGVAKVFAFALANSQNSED